MMIEKKFSYMILSLLISLAARADENTETTSVSTVMATSSACHNHQTDKRPDDPIVVETLYGSFDHVHPLIVDLLNSNAMQRLKHVQQYGVSYRVKELPSYTRYDHCLGVWAILYRYKASLQEQVAGLLHDASHTAFSHIADFLFKHSSPLNSYQDDIHEWYLKQTDIPEILMRHGFSCSDISPKNGSFLALEQNLPNLCADRIEYNLRGAIIAGLITPQEIESILADLVFDNGTWYFVSPVSAQRLGMISLHLTENEWASPGDLILCYLFAQTLQKALAIGLISLDDIHFSNDDIIWQKLESCTETELCKLITQVKNYHTSYTITPIGNENNCTIKGKFRGLNPLVKCADKLKYLTEIDDLYEKDFTQSKNLLTIGYPVKLSHGALEAYNLHESLTN